MSAFAGVFFRKTAPDQIQQWAPRLRQALVASGAKRAPYELTNDCAFILKHDTGAYSSRADAVTASGAIAVLAGHPYVDTIAPPDRLLHLGAIVSHIEAADTPFLAHCSGTYSLAHVDAHSRRLTLAADCLGVRPLYYLADSQKVLFSTTMAFFEWLGEVDLAPDERGMVEKSVLGFGLADRTQYRHIKCLSESQAIAFDANSAVSTRYWRWDGTVHRNLSPADSRKQVFDSFLEATRIRLATDTRVMAFLTGGLDSRCVVAALRLCNAAVNTMNFAPENSQDLVFGQQMAAGLQTNHLQLPMPIALVASKIATVMPQWQASTSAQHLSAEHPNLVWSGDGGSVGLGHVYLTDAMIDLMEAGCEEEAVQLLLADSTWIVPKGVLRRDRARALANYPLEGMLQALADIRCDDRGRALHILLMITDQRRHLFEHFERIYEHDCEMQLPFFDREFLLSVLRQPVRPHIGHRFYNEWLKLFQPTLLQIPWQAYRGHEPCPVPVPGNLSYQWSAQPGRSEANAARRAAGARTLGQIFGGVYRASAVSEVKLGLVSLATWSGLRDYRYALEFAESMRLHPSALRTRN